MVNYFSRNFKRRLPMCLFFNLCARLVFMRTAAIALLAPSLLLLGEDKVTWPQFRGPNSSGIAAADAAPPVEFGPSKRLLWKRPLPVGHSSPAVWGDRGFVTTFDTAAAELELICLAADTGAVLLPRAAAAPPVQE